MMDQQKSLVEVKQNIICSSWINVNFMSMMDQQNCILVEIAYFGKNKAKCLMSRMDQRKTYILAKAKQNILCP